MSRAAALAAFGLLLAATVWLRRQRPGAATTAPTSPAPPPVAPSRPACACGASCDEQAVYNALGEYAVAEYRAGRTVPLVPLGELTEAEWQAHAAKVPTLSRFSDYEPAEGFVRLTSPPNNEDIWHGDLAERVQAFDLATALASVGHDQIRERYRHLFEG